MYSWESFGGRGVSAIITAAWNHGLETSLNEQGKQYVDKINELGTKEHTARLLPAFHEYVKVDSHHLDQQQGSYELKKNL